MDDINFDELDKAVNSVLQQSPKVSEESRTEAVAEQEQPQPENTSENIAQPASEEVKRPAPAIAPKRRGQFMDMVHPSSDMTTPPAVPKDTLMKSTRQSATLQPLDPSIVEMSASAKEGPSGAAEETNAPEASAVESETPEMSMPPSIDADTAGEQAGFAHASSADVTQAEGGFTSEDNAEDAIDKLQKSGQADLNRSGFGQGNDHVDHTLFVDFAFERAAKSRTDRDLPGFPRIARHGDNGLGCFHRAIAGLALIGHGKRVGGDSYGTQLIDPAGFERASRPARIHHQADVSHVIALGQGGADRFCISHLWNGLWVHKTGDLDAASTGGDGTVNQADLVIGRNECLFVLEAVARGDLNDLDRF